ncbi:MAG: hypothetical protein KUL83_00625 [Lentimicrobium sp.]|jgi:hypothetical protein|nr:hypothetical protein [Lentimicrobium sp.]MDD2527585.1 hypothetical protein [Lentimicrobiaceae bacterium]MDD4597102.1 hypothetical protein [Lentimicrobiaceae bacterium]MDY0025103.1 hypothetical protein [Lentimicrobium sp.]HAH59232.1 hypothetical protein [Bacteroidales bacterium]
METVLKPVQPSHPSSKGIRVAWGILLVILALNAFGGGYYALAGAEGVPVEWLHGSPFHSYFIPGLFLMTIIGGGSLITAILVFAGHKKAFLWNLVLCLVIFAWLIVQVSIIGLVSFMQPATALAVMLILLLSLVYKNRVLSANNNLRNI